MNPSCVTEETPPDRPKSVRTRSVSELFDGVLVLYPCLNIGFLLVQGAGVVKGLHIFSSLFRFFFEM